MLKSLTINNYALIDALDISFPEGLVIITGETGAGKSILLGALSLLLGTKADASVIKDNTRNCVVEGIFDDDLIVRRVIYPTGRSRAFINDEPVSLAELASTASGLIDIHAQHQHLLLSDRNYQLKVIDYFAGTGKLLSEYQEKYRNLSSLKTRIQELEELIRKSDAEKDYIEFQWNQLDSAGLRPDELEQLESEQKSLANAESIREALSSALRAMNPSDVSLSQCIKESASYLSRISGYLKPLEDIVARLDSCRIEISDIESELENIAEGVLVSPERLQEVEERLSLLYSLLKKHNARTVSELMEIKDRLDASLSDTTAHEAELDRLYSERKAAESEVEALAEELSAARHNALAGLSSEITSSIQALEMPRAKFVAGLERKELNLYGIDGPSFLFSANSTKPADISKIASGGELSRVMLAIKALMARYSSMPTLIFDEIDTGVSGKVADRMGSMIGAMASNMQIIAITHLPQIASKKGTHFYVYKEFGNDDTARTQIKKLDRSEREVELARMLSGSALSEAALENARVLLNENENL